MMRALQAQNLCEAEGTALGLCLGSAGVTDLDDINACAFCSVDAIVNTGFDDCSASDVDGFYAYIQSCGVDACHTSCRDELQVAAECIIKVTCPDAASNDAATGGGFTTPITSTTLATTPPSTVETTQETASTGTVVENPCVICPNGPSTSLDDYAPYADDGDGRTCSQLIMEALTFETGTDECGLAEMDELLCCYTSPTSPCIICPDGATAGEDFVPDIEGNTLTCGLLIESSKLFSSESDSCRLYGYIVTECCPPSTCVICPNGPSTGLDDYAPNAIDGDSRTCAQLIQNALTIESGTEDCGWAELSDGIACCYSEPVNPCIMCPDGVTASLGDDYVPEYDDNTATCADLIAGAMRFESGSDACALYDIDAGYCCPPGMTSPPTPTPSTTRATTSQPSNSNPQSNAPTSQTSNSHPLSNTSTSQTGYSHPPSNPGKENSREVVSVAIAISLVAGIFLMTLAVYYLCKRASTTQGPQTSNPGGIVQMPQGDATTAVAMPIGPEIDPETINRPPSVWQM